MKLPKCTKLHMDTKMKGQKINLSLAKKILAYGRGGEKLEALLHREEPACP